MAINRNLSLLLLLSLLFSATLSLAYNTHSSNEDIDPETELQKCMERCKVIRMETQACQRRCLETYEEQKKEQQKDEGRESEEKSNPYYFRSHHFEARLRSEQGSLSVLGRFGRRSELLAGVDNCRVAFLEARPNSFVLPNHCDAESLFYIAKGSAIISIVRRNKRDSHNVKCGDILRVPAGSIIYMVNNDERENLQIVKLAMAVSTPGRFEEFFGAGGENPESYYRAFSQSLMEAAFNTDWGRLERMFQHKQGAIIHASKEQIQALSKGSSSRGSDNNNANWLFGDHDNGESGEEKMEPYRLLKRTEASNQYGKLYVATPDDYKPLRAINVAVSLANFTNGAMSGPHYDSLSTKISFVVQGTGYYEMVCPHLAASQSQQSEGSRGQEGEQGRESKQSEGSRGQEGEQGRGTRYARVGATLSPGDVLVAPAGHPVVITSPKNQNENLQILCFEFFANNNERVHLAGKDNALKQLEGVAKELSFGAPARQVDEILNKQRNSYFYPGPESRQGQGRAYE